MDYISEADRLKLYYTGLNEASEYHLPDEVRFMMSLEPPNPNYNSIHQEALALYFNVVGPLHQVISFIINNRLIHEGMTELLEEASGYAISFPPEEIFHALRSLEPYSAEEFIRTIDTDSATLHRLQQCYTNDDEHAFVSIINTGQCGLRAISFLCSLVWLRVSFSSDKTYEDVFNTLHALARTNTDDMDGDSQKMLRSAERTADEVLKIIRNEEDGDSQKYYISQYENAQTVFGWLRGLYVDNVKVFKPRERRIIEDILSRPEAKVQAASAMDGGDFHLPSDYFSLKNDSAYTDDYFTLRYEVVMAGPDKFTELINYLSDHGYIDNNKLVKQMFAYRFSAKMRPERIVPIEWHGRNGKSYELIYLIKCLTERADYRKMRRFFFGPQWVKDRDSSYAKNANYEFKLFLCRLYPMIADQLYNWL